MNYSINILLSKQCLPQTFSCYNNHYMWESKPEIFRLFAPFLYCLICNRDIVMLNARENALSHSIVRFVYSTSLSEISTKKPKF